MLPRILLQNSFLRNALEEIYLLMTSLFRLQTLNLQILVQLFVHFKHYGPALTELRCWIFSYPMLFFSTNYHRLNESVCVLSIRGSYKLL